MLDLPMTDDEALRTGFTLDVSEYYNFGFDVIERCALAADKTAFIYVGRSGQTAEAQLWLNLAEGRDGQFAKSQMHCRASKLTEAELQEATALAESWQPGDCEADLGGAAASATN